MKTLDIICNLANKYEVTPHKVMDIYNACINKKYNNLNYIKAIEQTKRYVRKNYSLRSNTNVYEHRTPYDFIKVNK